MSKSRGNPGAHRHSGRREFLTRIPTAVVAGLAAPALVTAEQTPAPAQGVTAETMAAAQQVAGVALPAAEREAARPLVARNLTNIEAIRRVQVSLELEPAFAFMPPRPGRPASGATGLTRPSHELGAPSRQSAPGRRVSRILHSNL